MDKQQIRMFSSASFKRLLKYFLQGMIVLAPIVITVYVIVSLFKWIDSILPNIVHAVFPSMLAKDIDGNIEHVPGLGFVFVIAIVLFVGWLSSLLLVGKLVDVLDKVLEKTPGIKFIYGSVKDFLEAFAGNKKKFDKAVLVNVDGENVWRVGFVTREDAIAFDMREHLVVYVPHSYAISGITYIVPKEKVKNLPNVAASDAMKFVVSGGVTE